MSAEMIARVSPSVSPAGRPGGAAQAGRGAVAAGDGAFGRMMDDAERVPSAAAETEDGKPADTAVGEAEEARRKPSHAAAADPKDDGDHSEAEPADTPLLGAEPTLAEPAKALSAMPVGEAEVMVPSGHTASTSGDAQASNQADSGKPEPAAEASAVPATGLFATNSGPDTRGAGPDGDGGMAHAGTGSAKAVQGVTAAGNLQGEVSVPPVPGVSAQKHPDGPGPAPGQAQAINGALAVPGGAANVGAAAAPVVVSKGYDSAHPVSSLPGTFPGTDDGAAKTAQPAIRGLAAATGAKPSTAKADRPLMQTTGVAANALPTSDSALVGDDGFALGSVSDGPPRISARVEVLTTPQANGQPGLAQAQVQQVARVCVTSLPGMVEVRLAPEELGALTLALDLEGEVVRVTVTAERPETLMLARRFSADLANELRAMGYGGASFSFQQDNTRGGSTAQWPQQEGGTGASVPSFEHPVAAALRPTPTGLDIRL